MTDDPRLPRRAALTLLALGVALAAPSAARAQVDTVTFEVEVPHCTPGGVLLRSNRLDPAVYRHDALTRVDRTRFTGTFELTTPRAQFDYKYAHSVCDETACTGIEKALEFTGSGAEIAPRTLPAGADRVSDLVFVWRDAVAKFDAAGNSAGARAADEQIAFCDPYLSISSETGRVSISYDAYDAGALVLEYGPTAAYGSSLSATGSHRNHFRLDGLTPGERYHYRITEDGAPGADHSFVAPPAATAAEVRFAHLGDVQYYSEEDRTEQKQVVGRILGFAPHLVVASGDLVGSTNADGLFLHPEAGRWNVFFGVAAPLLASAPFLTAMGNHEEDGDYYWNAFDFPQPDAPKIDHYWFKSGGVHFTVLYTGTTEGYDLGGILASQATWMQGVLAAANADPEVHWKVVVLHRGAFSQGSHHPTDGQAFYETETGGTSWGEIWETQGVDVVLAGHNHNFTLALNNGVRYVTTCGGAPIHDLRDPWNPQTIWAERTCAAGLYTRRGHTLGFRAERPDGSEIVEAGFDLCRAAADCRELDSPCPTGQSPAWSCTDGACEAACGANQAPGTPSLVTPADGAEVEPQPQLIVQGGGDPDGDPITLQVEIVAAGGGARVALLTSSPIAAQASVALTPTEALAGSAGFDWRARAVDPGGLESDWTGWRSFRVRETVTIPDAGTGDGGGSADAGASADAGLRPDPTNPPAEESGCGCASGAGAAPIAGLWLLVIGLRRRLRPGRELRCPRTEGRPIHH